MNWNRKYFWPPAKLLREKRSRHSGTAKRDPESRIFKKFWIPACTGITEEMTFARGSFKNAFAIL